MDRFKEFNATGIAPDGVLYAGDLLLMQDLAAALADFAQNVQVGTLAIGETGLTISRVSALNAQVSGVLRITKGMYPGEFTTAQRDAIAAGSRPHGLVIVNTTAGRLEWNAGTDAVPDWQPISTAIGAGDIGTTELADLAVTTGKLADQAVTAAKINNALKPSTGAAAGTEALRALGMGAALAISQNEIVQVNRSGTFAARPAAGTVPAGTTYFATDVGMLYRSTGAAWVRIGNVSRKFASRITSVSSSGNSFATGANVLAADIAITADGESAYMLSMGWADTSSGSSSTKTRLGVVLDGAQSATIYTQDDNNEGQVNIMAYLGVLAAGAHTVNVRLWNIGTGGTVTLAADTGAANTNAPLFMAVEAL